MSFTRRGGRLSDRQQAAWDAIGATHVLDVPRNGISTSVDPAYVFEATATFGRQAPLVVEIGTGRGDALVHSAERHRDHDFLGIEVYRPGIAQTLVTVQHLGLDNVRMMIVNAAEAVATMLPTASVHELRMWFPDPWHKVRHHKRRLVTPDFATHVGRVVEPGGTWRLATDWEDYAEQIRAVIAGSAEFDGGAWEPRFEERPLTRFESKGLAVGRTIRDVSAVRRTP